MDTEIIQDTSQILPADTLPPHLKLKEYLDERGIKYAFITSKLGFSRSWLTLVLKGQREFTDVNIEKVENLLNIKLR